MSDTGVTPIGAARDSWSPAGPYLNTASYGLPPKRAWDTLQSVLEDWRGGRTRWEPWSDYTEGARAAFARLVGTEAQNVATSTAVSQLVGQVASGLPDGARVLAPEIDFTSLIWPFLVHADRGVVVETVPLARLAEAVGSRTDVVAYSAVQSGSGEVADIDAIAAAARHHDALVCVDATQACGWLPLNAGTGDFVAAAAYKWLCSPRGSAFMAIDPAHAERMRPVAAGWWAADDPYANYYETELNLASTMRRFDVSPAWFSWAGAQPAIETLEEVGVEAIHDHDVGLANRFREGLGMPPGNSAIVSAEVPGAEEKLDRAGILASVRAGSLRAAFHVYNTDDHVDRALEALNS